MAGIWTSTTLSRIGPTIGMKPLWYFFFFFQQKRIGYVIFAGKRNNGSAACHCDKERDSHGFEKRNSSGTG
jgi:hypothetical protein